MKRGISIILLLCLVFSLSIPCFAAQSSVTPRYSHISTCSYGLSINSSGTATCTASCTALSSSNKVNVTCTFQGFNGTTWVVIRSWSKTNSTGALVSEQASCRSDITDYRVKATFSIYDSSDNLLETVTYYDYDYYIPSN